MEKVDMVNSLFHSTYAYCNWPYNMALKRLNSILKTKYIMCYNSLEENGLSSYSSHDG